MPWPSEHNTRAGCNAHAPLVAGHAGAPGLGLTVGTCGTAALQQQVLGLVGDRLPRSRLDIHIEISSLFARRRLPKGLLAERGGGAYGEHTAIFVKTYIKNAAFQPSAHVSVDST